MNVLITMVGRSNWGLINSIWADIRCHNYVPEKIYIVGTEIDFSNFRAVEAILPILLKEYTPSCTIVAVKVEDDPSDIAKKIRAIAEDEKAKGNMLALDATPGRKQYLLGAMLVSSKKRLFDHLYYLSIETLKNAKRPFMIVPLTVQRSKDLLKEGLP